ncbi:MAG: bifunctional adenosylcobinamide kinase/adenosylcobinamide-phosphate guanylyltransferase [Marinifilaceae bacterium]|jgi:adenosylcobinamide kinase/adenosylcobinamide-phosphate guanylyltransferase
MIYLITGGQRSGKSQYAEKLALELSETPVYLATSRVWDEGQKERIELHKKRRGAQWESIEEEKHVGQHDFSGKVVLLDCITLWLTNYFFDNEQDVQKSLEEAKTEITALLNQDCTLIMVTNELGLGGHPNSEMAMKFNDLQGWMNQFLAEKADRVTMIVSGLPMQLK